MHAPFPTASDSRPPRRIEQYVRHQEVGSGDARACSRHTCATISWCRGETRTPGRCPSAEGWRVPRGKPKAPPTFLAQSFRGFSIFLLAVAALTIAFPEEPFAQAPEPAAELTFDHALRLAEEHSFSLQAQDARGRSSRERAVSAGSLPDPVLRFSVDNLPVTGSMRYSLTDDFMTMRSVGLSQTFTGTDKRDARRDRFEREAELASALRAVELARLRTETARAWFDRFYQQRILNLLERPA